METPKISHSDKDSSAKISAMFTSGFQAKPESAKTPKRPSSAPMQVSISHPCNGSRIENLKRAENLTRAEDINSPRTDSNHNHDPNLTLDLILTLFRNYMFSPR